MTSILVISEKYWPYGGAELATHLILKMLSSLGSFRIMVLTGCKDPERIAKVRYVYDPLLDIPTKIHLWKNLAIMKKRPAFKRLIKWADIIYIPRIAYPIIPLARELGKKIIVHLHDYQPVNFQSMILHPCSMVSRSGFVGDIKQSLVLELLEYGSLKRALASSALSLINSLCRFWLSEADKIICVSERQASIIVNELPELKDKLKVIYNPLLNVPLIEKTPSEPPSMLYLGGDLYTKGFHVLMKSSYELLKRGVYVKFLLARCFKDTNRLLIKRLNERFNKPYNLLGFLKHEEVLRLHSLVHALIFPSIGEEPLPYVITESMLAGTMPIASKVGGVPEIVKGTYAEEFLFTPGNVNELIDRMEKVLSLSKEQLIDIGVKLREAILKKFDEDVIKNQLLEVFTD